VSPTETSTTDGGDAAIECLLYYLGFCIRPSEGPEAKEETE
jgi:hypothetical protein